MLEPWTNELTSSMLPDGICKRIADSTDPRCDLHCAREKQTGWGWNLRSIPDHKDQNGIKDQVAADLYKNFCGIQDRGVQGKCRTGRFI